jgi:hypothetical protein
MASAAGLVLTAGVITAANEVVFSPVAAHTPPHFNWRIIPATAILAMAFGALENLSPALARGLGWSVILTVVLAPVGEKTAPVENITKALGFK